MAGSYERLLYDPNAYELDLKQSTDPIRWTLDPIRVNRCDPCRPVQPGYIGKVGVSITHQRPLVDVESELMRLDQPNSRDPRQRYIPKCPQCKNCGQSGYPCGGGVVAGCSMCQEKLFNFPPCHIGTEYTRISNPICTSKETGVNRFQPLCLNPQDENRWLHPGEVGINYRMVVKDNHRPCIPKPIDQTPLLPRGGPLPPLSSPEVCGWYVEPLHEHYRNVDRNWNCLPYV